MTINALSNSRAAVQLGLTVIGTERAWITGGIHAPVGVFYALFILMAGMLLGVRGSLVTATVCVVGAIVLAVATALSWLSSPPNAGSALGGFVFILLGIGLALVVEALFTYRLNRDAPSTDVAQMLVHDMRAPLQIVLGHLEMLRDSPGESVKDVESAFDGAIALQRLTNSFLDVSRLEAGRMPIRPSVTNLSVLAHSVVLALRILQPARNIEVEAEGNSACRCDPELTRRIIENLVTNAMKHTPMDVRVRVITSGLPDRVSVAVYTDGPGVPASQRTTTFDPYSAEGLRSANGGASCGLGLAFCRLASETQGGTIRIEDGNPRGSVFIMELPR